MVRGQILIGAIALLGLLATTGCEEFLNAFDPDSGHTMVNVLSTHHATPENGVVPDRGGDGEVRVFDNDTGWSVHLAEAYVTTRDVTLERCDGNSMAVDQYFGSLAESFTDEDLGRSTIGGVEVGRSELCSMIVHYGPFDAANDEPPEDVDGDDLDGITLLIAGWATSGEDTVPFEFESNASLDVHLDLSVMADGEPVRVTGDEEFPVELTLAKTYDRLFDGVDFDTADEADLAAGVVAMLEHETRVLTD